jgi:AcrR family transcriptional regulator
MAKRARSYVVSLENRKARGLGHERPAEILDAARELFLAHGLENVSTRQIASRVGISQTALYVYFKNKEEMLDSLVDAAFVKLSTTIQSIDVDRSDVVAYLRGAMRAYIQFGLDNPDEYRLAFLLRDARRGGEASAELGCRTVGAKAFGILETLVAEGVSAGAIKSLDGNGQATAQVLWAAIHGRVALLIAYPDFGWVDRDLLIEAHIMMLLEGVVITKRGRGPTVRARR